MKYFREEIENLLEKLKSGEKFSFSKYADGEWMAMLEVNMNNKEFEVTEDTKKASKELRKSFCFKDENYFVGISCPCCNAKHHYGMKEYSYQDEKNLTFANIFVNSNYDFFVKNFVEEFSNHSVHLVANEKSNIKNLPFEVEKFYPVGFSAWINNCNLIDEIISEKHEDKLFLFCAGPFGNILAHRLWEANKKNIYMDIGSTLNPWLESEGFKRGYFSGPDRNQVCVWSQ